MFGYNYKSLRQDEPVAEHNGIFYKQISLFQGVALILGGTIGAGILSLPYAIAKVGVLLGFVYIVGMGLLMMGFNLLVGSIAMKANEKMQIVGFAKKYLGVPGQIIMTVLMYFTLWGILSVYINGEGIVLSALFGGSDFFWSIAFFIVAALLIFIGMRAIKIIGIFLSLGILIVVLALSMYSAPHIQINYLQHVDLTNLFYPYGVLLFAFYGATSIPEVHSILLNRDKMFRKAIIIAGLITIVVYLIFTLVVVGVTGQNTSEIATIALGQKLGSIIYVLGNVFAMLAMGSGCLVAGLGMRDSMVWDFKLPRSVATFLVCGIPFLMFAFGVRGFVNIIGVIGGVLMSAEMFIILLIFWRAKKSIDMPVDRRKLDDETLLFILLLVALSLGAVYSLFKLF